MDFKLEADDLQEVVVLCDRDGILLSWNRAGEEITGFSREDVVGYHIDSIVAPGSRAELKDILGMQRSGTVLPGMPVKLQTSYGMEVPVEVTSVPQHTGDTLTGWLLIFRDTTLKVQLQEQLDRMDVLYRGLVENSSEIIYVLDAAARVLFINDTVETLLGYAKKDLLGKDLIEIVHPDDRSMAFWPLRERRKAARATKDLQIRLLAKAGAHRRYDLEIVYISLNSVGLGAERHEPGKPAVDERLGTQGVARDVTELVLLQDFSRQVGFILPICSVCGKIRVTTGTTEEWLPLSKYVERKTGMRFSHTYCPEHVPVIS
jgi:PAS domain S-box-containing protein